jgi:phosphatidylserine/phosphatidylglycerophosphate/cardiolipin synthase-like enzyme
VNNLILVSIKKLLHLSEDLIHSRLFDETTFYKQFIHDLKRCKKEVIIESPYITSQRMCSLSPVFEYLVTKKVKVYVITRDPDDHDLPMKQQAAAEIRQFEMIGVQVLINTDYSHRKLAILDRKVLWEGSLNILSQTYSREIMRRIESKYLALQMFTLLKFKKFIY